MPVDASSKTSAGRGPSHPKDSFRLGRRNTITIISVYIFLISLAIPVQFFIGPLRLSSYRIVLVLIFVPCIISLISGRCGKIRAPDILIAFSALWGSIALLTAHGLDGVEGAGIRVIETFGSYLVARCYIRSIRGFEKVVRVLFFVVLILIPFTFLEFLTDRNILLDALGTVFYVHDRWDIEQRLGFYRALGTFEHPILYGVFCASLLGLVFYVLGHGRVSVANCVRSGLVAIATFFSLSAGPIVALVCQMGLIGWSMLTSRIPHRWTILCGLVVGAYFTVDILSNRNPVEVFISYLTFNPHNAYYRVWIWHYGTAEVLRNPIFGIGLNEWQRASWMLSDSLDNFWLVQAVRYGLPSLGSLVAALVPLGTSIARLRTRDKRVQSYRIGWFVTIIGLAIAGSTVHYWNAVYCLFMFLVGSGVWMLEYNSGKNLSRRRMNPEREKDFRKSRTMTHSVESRF